LTGADISTTQQEN